MLSSVPPTMPAPFVSLVIPAYNEAHRLPNTLNRCVEFFRQWGHPWEILVVDDGSTDGTAAAVAALGATVPEVRCLTVPHGGKGLAVRAGMLAAGGRWRMFADADLAVDITQLPDFLVTHADVAIGSREAPGARRIGEPFTRHLIGRVFNLFVQILVLRGVSDTQCGCKMFSAESARTLFSQSRLRGFGFDVELLYLAKRHGLSLREIPVVWHYRPGSRVRVGTGLSAFLQLAQIRWNALTGAYDD